MKEQTLPPTMADAFRGGRQEHAEIGPTDLFRRPIRRGLVSQSRLHHGLSCQEFTHCTRLDDLVANESKHCCFFVKKLLRFAAIALHWLIGRSAARVCLEVSMGLLADLLNIVRYEVPSAQ